MWVVLHRSWGKWWWCVYACRRWDGWGPNDGWLLLVVAVRWLNSVIYRQYIQLLLLQCRWGDTSVTVVRSSSSSREVAGGLTLLHITIMDRHQAADCHGRHNRSGGSAIGEV